MKSVSVTSAQEFPRQIVKPSPDFSDYCYNCSDQSILLEPFKRYYLTYWHRFIPAFITANAITIGASALMWLNFLAILIYADTFPSGAKGIFAALCLHLYVVGDNLDGMRAKASGTSSPLGEFLDHYLDTYNISLSVIISAYLFGIEETYFILPVIFMMVMSFIFTMADQKITGQLFFGRINSLEMSMALALSFLLLCVPAYGNFWSLEVAGGLKIYTLLVLISILLQLPIIFMAAKRMKYIPRNLLLFVASFLGLLMFTLWDVDLVVGTIILTFYGAEYVGRIILSHVGRLPFPPPRYGSIAIMVIYAILRNVPNSAEYHSLFSIMLAIYFVLTALIVFAHSFWLMRSFWIWKNPQSTRQIIRVIPN